MDIHQMQVRYDAAADRILWQVRTTQGELFAAWLTRRMSRQLWPLFQGLVAQTVLPTPPGDPMRAASVMPEAREMLMQAARERPLPSADFDAPFEAPAAPSPLGADPLLPVSVDLGPGPQGQGLAMALREAAGRTLRLTLTADMGAALMRLLDKALADADWGITPAAAQAPAAASPPRVLN